MIKSRLFFSSQRLDWKTPKEVYQTLDAEFNFDFDPCPTNPKFDGLKVEWKKSNFVNPPYGKELPKWIKKGYEQSRIGKTVVFLIPSRTDTRWWHEYCMKADEIRFIKGRLKFDGQKSSAPFPSAIIVFRKAEVASQIEKTRRETISNRELYQRGFSDGLQKATELQPFINFNEVISNEIDSFSDGFEYCRSRYVENLKGVS